MSTQKSRDKSSIGEERPFCFMSIDMVGHSSLTGNLPLGSTYDLMNAFHDWIERTLVREGGEVWSWAGDGALCAFSPKPVKITEKAQSCVRAAMAIRESLPAFNQQREETRKSPIRLRVACHLGFAQDSPQKGRVFSESINFVAHLEHQRTLENTISITQQVYKQLDPRMRRRFQPAGEFSGEVIYSTANVKQIHQMKSQEETRYRQAAASPRQRRVMSHLLSGTHDTCVYYLREVKVGAPLVDAVTGFEPFNDGPMVSSNDLLSFWNMSDAFAYRVFEPGVYSRPVTLAVGKDIMSLGYNAVTEEILGSLKRQTTTTGKEPGCGFFSRVDDAPTTRYSYVHRQGALDFAVVPPKDAWVQNAWGYAVFQRLIVGDSHAWFLFGNRGITTMILGKTIGEHLGQELKKKFGGAEPFAALYKIEYGQAPKALWMTGDPFSKLRKAISR